MTDEITAAAPPAPETPAPEAPPPDHAPPAPEPIPAADRLRAFEDKHFGKKAVRIRGAIERGFGSPFQLARQEIRDFHDKLEKLVEAEQKLAEAHAAVLAADTAHDAALKAVEVEPDVASDE